MLPVRERSNLETGTGLSELIAVYDSFKNQLSNHFHLFTGERKTSSAATEKNAFTGVQDGGEIRTSLTPHVTYVKDGTCVYSRYFTKNDSQ
jgi:hypothetical protein